MLNSFVSVLDSGGAGGAAGSFESIATTTLTGNQATVTFSGIPSTYKHLQIRVLARTATVTNVGFGYLQFNSDTGSNYARHYIIGNGSSASVAAGASASSMWCLYYSGANISTSTYGVGIIDVHDYASTTKNKTIRSFTGMDGNTGITTSTLLLESGVWLNTAAVTSLTISGDFDYASGSVFSLYGIKGA